MKKLSIKFDTAKHLEGCWDTLKERLFENGHEGMPIAGTLSTCKGGFRIEEIKKDDKEEFPSMTKEKLTFKKLQEIEKKLGHRI